MEKMDKLKQLCKEARWMFGTEQLIIAGGAPRDVLTGVPIKDIDIFVRMPEDGDATWFSARCQALATFMDWKVDLRPSNPEYAYYFDLADFHDATGKLVAQVIGLFDDPVDDVVKYDFDLSQIFVTPNGVFVTEAAHAARQARTISYVPSAQDQFALYRSKARLGRLRAKYDGWTFANCDVLDALPEQPAAPQAEDVL